MRRWQIFQKAFHGLLSVLYLSLSFYVISCAFHHDPVQPYVHSHDHPGEGNGQPKGPDAGEGLFCKFMQNTSAAAVVSSHAAATTFHALPHETTWEVPIASKTVEGVYLSRGPPVVFS
jgi:hypothetical protein